jgi:hypothetical protein
MANEPVGGRFRLWTVLVIVTTVASGAASAGWEVGRAKIKDELDQYKKSSEWQLPATLHQLGTLSKRLNLTLDERKRLEEEDQVRTTNQQLRNELARKTELLEAAQKRMRSMEGDTIED